MLQQIAALAMRFYAPECDRLRSFTPTTASPPTSYHAVMIHTRMPATTRAVQDPYACASKLNGIHTLGDMSVLFQHKVLIIIVSQHASTMMLHLTMGIETCCSMPVFARAWQLGPVGSTLSMLSSMRYLRKQVAQEVLRANICVFVCTSHAFSAMKLVPCGRCIIKSSRAGAAQRATILR